MYRTAILSVYDVLDQVFVSAKVMTYSDTPGKVPPTVSVWSTTVSGVGEDDTSIWLWRALQGLQEELDNQ